MTNKHRDLSRTRSSQRRTLSKGLFSPTRASEGLAAITGNMGMFKTTRTPEKMMKQGCNKVRDKLRGQQVPHLPSFRLLFHCTASAQAVSEVWAQALSSPPKIS